MNWTTFQPQTVFILKPRRKETFKTKISLRHFMTQTTPFKLIKKCSKYKLKVSINEIFIFLFFFLLRHP